VARSLKQRLGRAGEGFAFLVEISGGLTEANVGAYVEGVGRDVDVVSSSAIHQGVPHVDFSLKVVPVKAEGNVKGESVGDQV